MRQLDRTIFSRAPSGARDSSACGQTRARQRGAVVTDVTLNLSLNQVPCSELRGLSARSLMPARRKARKWMSLKPLAMTPSARRPYAQLHLILPARCGIACTPLARSRYTATLRPRSSGKLVKVHPSHLATTCSRHSRSRTKGRASNDRRGVHAHPCDIAPSCVSPFQSGCCC